jgi:hypothetical protein
VERQTIPIGNEDEMAEIIGKHGEPPALPSNGSDGRKKKEGNDEEGL